MEQEPFQSDFVHYTPKQRSSEMLYTVDSFPLPNTESSFKTMTSLADGRLNNGQKLVIKPSADFALDNPEHSRSHSKSIDRFIPSRKSSNISNRINFVEGSTSQDSKNMMLSKFKNKILGLSSNSNSLKYSTQTENETPTIPDFIVDRYYQKIQRRQRVIPKTPFKVLDAPSLQDDFYLNLVDWSPANLLCVGLTSMVYMWASDTCKVTRLCDMQDTVTSISCSNYSNEVAVATNSGKLQIYDILKQKLVRQLQGNKCQRVGTLNWSSKLLASGSRDKNIYIYDIRSYTKIAKNFHAHKQEICGVKWSYDDQQLASGGNDNKLCIWDMRIDVPLFKFYKHKAAIKALSWSPHQHGLLASGGGTKDRTIKFWNTIEGKETHSVDTGSQVCNLLFSKNTNEIVSTHGYSQNQIMFWKSQNLQHFETLTGHRLRVLYIALSPDGKTIVTGGGDETLRFWKAFPENGSNNLQPSSMLSINDNFLH